MKPTPPSERAVPIYTVEWNPARPKEFVLITEPGITRKVEVFQSWGEALLAADKPVSK